MKQRTPPSRLMKPFVTLGRTISGLLNSWLNAYPSLDPTRKEGIGDFRPRYGSSNQILGPGLTRLSAQCRQIERATPLGRAVSEGLTADLIGSGIALQPNSGDIDRDAKLQIAFEEWAESCMADGSSLWSWQSTIPRELCTSGNALARLIVMPERARKGLIPLALLPLEVEWLSELPVGDVSKDMTFVRGIVLDKLGIPRAYHLRNPELMVGMPGEIVPAEEFIHIFERRRPSQVFGEPILAPAVERILQDARLVETELKAAVITAAPAVFIESPTADGQGATDDDGNPVTDIPAGSVVRGLPGEKLTTIENNRPSQQIQPFREGIHGDVAASCRVSRYWLARDPSKANYSSMRMDQLLTKRSLVGLKEVIGCGAAGKVYEAVFPWLALSLGIALPSVPSQRAALMKYDLRPDEPEYVDPTKDIQAGINAIANNLSSYGIELGNRGKDWRSIFRQRAIENALLKEAGLPIPTPQQSATKPPAQSDTADNPDNPNADGTDTAAEDAA